MSFIYVLTNASFRKNFGGRFSDIVYEDRDLRAVLRLGAATAGSSSRTMVVADSGRYNRCAGSIVEGATLSYRRQNPIGTAGRVRRPVGINPTLQ